MSTTATTSIDESLRSYVNLASKSEQLKSDERALAKALDNIREIRTILVEKEREFCNEDQNLRVSPPTSLSSTTNYGHHNSLNYYNGDSNQYNGYHKFSSVKDSLRKRCFNLIYHLVHYKCVVECLSSEILSIAGNLIDDDEYIHLSLLIRDVEVVILEAIKQNQQLNEVLLSMHDEEAQSYLAEVERKWRTEHQERRKLLSKLILDQNQFIIDKTTRNLEHQQMLLNQRYESINNLIKMSYKQSSGVATR